MIDPDIGIIDRRAIAVLLPLVDIRLSEGDVVTKRVEMLVNATVIGGSAIPVT